MTAYEAEAPVVVRDPSDAPAARISRFATRLPVHIFLAVVGVLWLMPTLGLFFTSLLSPVEYQSNGWWKVLAHPHLATWANYSNVWHNTDIPHSLFPRRLIRRGHTLRVGGNRADQQAGATPCQDAPPQSP